ncbi:MAG: TIGR03435 family protein [Bryobacteraceae bacterium]
MRLIPVVSCLTLACLCAYGQAADAPSFEVASIKPASPSATRIACSGGPGTTDPGIWSCTNVPLAFVISNAYGFQAPQFTPVDSCCQARFDIAAKVPAGTTKEQFQRMQQNLLTERFKLAFHHEQKEMPIYELTVGEKGLKVKESAPDAALAPEEPWSTPKYSMGKDGYPVFPAGHGGLAGINGHYRWTGVNLSMQEIVKTLSYHLGRPVVDATGLKGKYEIDMTWTIDLAWIMENAGRRDLIGGLPDDGRSGPTLIRAVQDELGLKLNSKKGPGDIVVIDHVEKVPIEN